MDEFGSIYMSGAISDDLAGLSRSEDIFLAKYDTNGQRAWLRRIGTNEKDSASVAVDFRGSIYINGYTEGFLVRPDALGEFLIKFANPIPEPCSAALLTTGACFVMSWRRRR
jgi:hypothetical protein